MGFSQALSGLNAASSSLDVLGNNIANSQTVGYKSSGAQFADIYAGSTGLGTQVSAVLQDFSDGNIENTGRNLDLAISGDGFYRFQQEGEVVYSRNGQLSMTADGYLENAQGARIMGYGLNAANEVQAGGQPEVIQVPADDMPASATANVATSFNLDARETVGEGLSQATVSTDMTDPANTEQTLDYQFSNNFAVYDSLGNPRNVTVYYQKAQLVDNSQATPRDVFLDASTGNRVYDNGGTYEDQGGTALTPQPAAADLSPVEEANTWNAKVAMDGHYNAANDFTVAFDTNGQLETINGAAANVGNMPAINVTADNTTPLGAGPADMAFALDITGSTQFGNTSATNSLTQDGYTSGALVGISIQDDGTVMRNYANEQSIPAGQIALANFRNPEGLEAVGDNAWRSTAASGQELVGEAGTGVLGTITSGAIETSNVDLASELVDMIVTQRAYQANSQTISTQDEVLQAAINLSR
ncbi:flagellar hook protein FlgE [Halomonas salina]|uniref:Flagellar hook protein FlgE n=1 Tax=Halomonas salina TaxID=42565 RepID=A0ABR4WVV3_9GAMM|nr:flagellar hook protein FlgE [Halomonas salina]KGE78535.1 flagellar hook protein FlgE [Halomonas salina]